MTDLPAPALPSLDYAYLANYAEVQPSGTLTAVGASFTYLQTQALPNSKPIAIAGRVRVAEGSGPARLGITIQGPGEDAPQLAIEMLATHEDERAYDGRVGLLFAINVQFPLLSEGLHTVIISIEDQPVRKLAFTVEKVSR